MQKSALILILLFLAGCGFSPLYVERESGSKWYYNAKFDTSIVEEMQQVKVEPIADRFGQQLRNNLLDSLTPKGAPKHPKYRLFVKLTSKRTYDQALRQDITATRRMVVYKVSYYMMEGTNKGLIQLQELLNHYNKYDRRLVKYLEQMIEIEHKNNNELKVYL